MRLTASAEEGLSCKIATGQATEHVCREAYACRINMLVHSMQLRTNFTSSKTAQFKHSDIHSADTSVVLGM